MIEEPEEEREEGTKDTGDESNAADHDSGQEQEPKQAGDSGSFFDTEQHSDAPGPFGTGSTANPGADAADDDDDGEDESAGGED